MYNKKTSRLKYVVGDQVAAGTIVGLSDQPKKYLIRCRTCGLERELPPSSTACSGCYRSRKSRYNEGTVLPDGRKIIAVDTETSTLKRVMVACVACGSPTWKFSSTMYSPCFACSCKQKTGRGDPNKALTNRLYSYQHSASKRGYVWELSDDAAIEMFKSNCHYCGIEPSPLNGIDRYNNKIGYTLDNCVPCCEMCNRSKWKFNGKEWEAWIMRLVKYRG